MKKYQTCSNLGRGLKIKASSNSEQILSFYSPEFFCEYPKIIPFCQIKWTIKELVENWQEQNVWNHKFDKELGFVEKNLTLGKLGVLNEKS